MIEEIQFEEEGTNLPISLSEINSSNFIEIKRNLENWKPKNAHEAIVMRHLIYLIENNAKELKAEIAAMLDRCVYCDNERVDSESGLKVLRKLKPSTSTYEDKELDELLRQKEELESKIKERKSLLTPITTREEGYNYTIKI